MKALLCLFHALACLVRPSAGWVAICVVLYGNISGAELRLPPHKTYRLSGEELRGFTLSDFQTLEAVVEDWNLLDRANRLMIEEITEYRKLVHGLDDGLKAEEERGAVLKVEVERLRGGYLDCEKRVVSAEIRAASPWPVVMTGVGGSVALASTVGYLTGERSGWLYASLVLGYGVGGSGVLHLFGVY